MSTSADDQRHICEGLHVVEDARSIPDPALRCMDVFRPGLAHLAFQGIHQGRRFSGDEGTRALVHGHIEIEASAQYVLAEQALFSSLLQGKFCAFHCQGVFHTHVDETAVRSNSIRCDDQALQNTVRISLHERTIHESTWISLIAIDNHILGLARSQASRFPFPTGGKSTSAPSPKIGLFYLSDHLFRSHFR